MMKTRYRSLSSALILATLGALVGCQGDAPPPARVAIPGAANRDESRDMGVIKPIAPLDERIDMRVDQRVPDPKPSVAAPPPAAQPGQVEDNTAKVQKDFVDAYHQVGQPKIAVFVNRGLQGDVISDVPPPADAPYLKAGAYDEPSKPLDYAAVERAIVDHFSISKQVMVLDPDASRQKLSDAQVKDLQSGKSEALASLDERLNADVLIQVQAHPTHQTTSGLEIRLVAEAINIRGGQVIGRAVADIDRAQEGEQIEGASRYIVKKLMIDMLRAWTAPEPAPK